MFAEITIPALPLQRHGVQRGPFFAASITMYSSTPFSKHTRRSRFVVVDVFPLGTRIGSVPCKVARDIFAAWDPDGVRGGMKKWLRRIRGAIGMGLTWAVAWGGAGAIMVLGFVLVTGHRPDPPVPLMFSAFGFVAGVIFSGVLGLVEGRRRFDQMSLPRFAAWGAAGGFLLSAAFVTAVALAGDRAFLWNLVVVGPAFAVAAAGSAAGSLALARRAQDRELLETAEQVPGREEREGLRNRH